MKRVRNALILLLVVVPVLLLSRWSGEARAPWSRRVDGVRARLAAPRFLWKPGESVPLTLRIEASGGTSGLARHALPPGLPLELVVTHEGREIRRVAPAPLAESSKLVADPSHRSEVTLPMPIVLDDGPGLYAVTGRFGRWDLRPLKLRVTKPPR